MEEGKKEGRKEGREKGRQTMNSKEGEGKRKER